MKSRRKSCFGGWNPIPSAPMNIMPCRLDEGARLCGKRSCTTIDHGEIDESAALQWLQKYAVMEPARAQQRVNSSSVTKYVINYNLGRHGAPLHRETKRRRSGKRWSEFGKLLSRHDYPADCSDI